MAPAITIRPFDGSDADYEAAVTVANTIHPDHARSANELRSRDHNTDPAKYYRRRWLAVDGAGTAIGCSYARHMPWAFDPDRYAVWIGVLPDRQRQGIGGLMFEHLLGELRPRNAKEMWTDTSETLTDALGFLARRGFEEKSRLWESRLNVPAFDPAPYAPLLERTVREGIRLVTLAEVQRREPKWLEVIYELDTTLCADIPMPVPYTCPSLEDYTREVVNDPGFLPDGYFLAMDGAQYVGVSFVERRELLPHCLAHGFTGVRREYRGRGIATALKVKTIEYAQQHRYAEILTDNSTLNGPMLAVNEKLGFVRQPAWVELVKRL